MDRKLGPNSLPEAPYIYPWHRLLQCSGSVVAHSLFIVAPFVCVCVGGVFCCVVLSVLARFVTISLGKRERAGCLFSSAF